MTVPMAARAAAALVVLASALPGPAQAQAFPTKTIRIVVPLPAGGALDLMARTVGQKLSEQTGRPVVVDNRPGGAMVVGTEIVARTEPDGHTLLVTATPHVVNASLQAKIPYDPIRDFEAVTLLAELQNALVAHPSLPVKTVRELVALAASRPGEINYASGGNGTSQHLSGELFNAHARVKLVHVPYKGGAPALNDLLGGHVTLMFNNLPETLRYVRAGKLRALGVTGAKRSRAATDIPTIAEQGLPGYEAVGWQGMMVPAKTPREVITRLHAESVKAMNSPDVRERFTGMGYDLVVNSPAEFSEIVRRDLGKWAKVVKDSGARAD